MNKELDHASLQVPPTDGTISPEQAQVARIAEINRRFRVAASSELTRIMSVIYLSSQPDWIKAWARIAQAAHVQRNGYHFTLQAYEGGPGYEGDYRDAMVRHPLLEDGSLGVKGTIEIVLRENNRLHGGVAQEPIRGRETLSDDPGDTRDLSIEEAMIRAEEILTSFTSSKPN